MSTPAPSGASPKPGLHPGIVVGAIAVVVFGAAGAASYLGLLPGQAAKAPASPVGMSSPAQQAGTVPDAVVPPKPEAPAPAPAPAPGPAPVTATAALQPAPAPEPAQTAPAPEPAQSAPAPAPVNAAPQPHSPAKAPPKPHVAKPAAAHTPAVAMPAPGTPSYSSGAPSPAAAPPAPVAESAPAPAPCRNCGTISSITPVEKKGEGSGAGAVLGGIVGGVLGHQVGGGRGQDVATVAGALGGALLGNEIEKNKNAVTAWDVHVRLEDGASRVMRYSTEPSWRVGDRVRIENGKLVRG